MSWEPASSTTSAGSGLRSLWCLVLLPALTTGVLAQQPSVQPVGIVYAERKPISQTSDFVGRIQAIDRVEVQARVRGYLEAIKFKEGESVSKGAPLYQIEKGLFQAAVDEAQGALQRAKAAKTLTEIELQRKSELLEKQAGTAVARDIAKSADEQAAATILSAQAALETAKINLGYTDIASPISGKVGKTNITPGNVVGPESGTLTLIVSKDPMYVTFPVSEREIVRLQSANRQGVKGMKVKLRFADGSLYDQEGLINFVGVSVDRATDTVTLRATIPNPKDVLIDGQLLSVALQTGHAEEKVLVPQAALIADQQGIYVFVVDDGKAAVRRVKTGGEAGTNVVIDSGLQGGEAVIVEGLQSIRPGTAVQASPAATTISRN
jgi:membrane fusion protein, multidrug efflux system